MQAAEILCPAEAALYRQGGEALETAIDKELHRLSFRANRYPELRANAWLTLALLGALRGRPDLQLTGRNLFAPLAPRIAVEADILQAVCERNNDDGVIHRRWVHIDFQDDGVSSGHDVPPTHFNPAQPQHLIDIRIEASSSATPPPAVGETDATKLSRAVEQWGAWYIQRHAAWPKDQPPPTYKQDCADGTKQIGIAIPRKYLRQIRNKFWITLKRGRRYKKRGQP